MNVDYAFGMRNSRTIKGDLLRYRICQIDSAAIHMEQLILSKEDLSEYFEVLRITKWGTLYRRHFAIQLIHLQLIVNEIIRQQNK